MRILILISLLVLATGCGDGDAKKDTEPAATSKPLSDSLEKSNLDLPLLSDLLYAAIESHDAVTVDSLLGLGAQALVRGKEKGWRPIDEAMIEAATNGSDTIRNIYKHVLYNARHSLRETIDLTGKLLVEMEYEGINSNGRLGASVSLFLDVNGKRYLCIVALRETDFNNAIVDDGSLVVEVGGEYRIRGSLNANGSIEADYVEFTDAGSSLNTHSDSLQRDRYAYPLPFYLSSTRWYAHLLQPVVRCSEHDQWDDECRAAYKAWEQATIVFCPPAPEPLRDTGSN